MQLASAKRVTGAAAQDVVNAVIDSLKVRHALAKV
jgi:hypothetical protein